MRSTKTVKLCLHCFNAELLIIPSVGCAHNQLRIRATDQDGKKHSILLDCLEEK